MSCISQAFYLTLQPEIIKDVMKTCLFFLFMMLLCSPVMAAEDDVFSVTTLNVDGLPKYIDKILYINPVSGNRLKLESYQLATDYTWDDGTPMGDHYPVSAVFRFVSDDASAIQHLESSDEQQVWSLDGRPRPNLQKGLNIVRTRDGIVRKVVLP